MRSVHIGRQPIYDRTLEVHGYELLFRPNDAVRPVAGPIAPADRDAALTQVIVNTLTEHGLDRLVGDRLAFVTVTRPFLGGGMFVPFGPEQAVLELARDVVADDEVLEGCKLLVEAGYQLALDDFRWEPERVELLPYVSYLKVDASRGSDLELADLVLRAHEARRYVVAQHIGDMTTMEVCQELGFDYFQGYFYLRPAAVVARTMTPSHLAFLQVLSMLSDPDVSLAEVEDIVRTDQALNFRVLRAANSASSGLRRQVDSIRDALVLLGAQRLRAWLLPMAVADNGDTDEAQLTAAMARARACELMAQGLPGVRPASAFVVGILSGVDLVLGIPMEHVLSQLPLTDDLKAALLERTGPLGDLLDAVLAYEREELATVAASPYDVFDLSRAYLEALGWSLQLCETARSA